MPSKTEAIIRELIPDIYIDAQLPESQFIEKYCRFIYRLALNAKIFTTEGTKIAKKDSY